MLAARGIQAAVIGGLAVSLRGRPRDEDDMRSIIATQAESLDWNACLDLARQLGAAVDIDIESRLRAARGSGRP